MSLKNGVLEVSRLDFGGPRVRFWRVWGRFSRDFRTFWGHHVPRRKCINFCPEIIRMPKAPRTPRVQMASPERPEQKLFAKNLCAIDSYWICANIQLYESTSNHHLIDPGMGTHHPHHRHFWYHILHNGRTPKH